MTLLVIAVVWMILAGSGMALLMAEALAERKRGRMAPGSTETNERRANAH